MPRAPRLAGRRRALVHQPRVSSGRDVPGPGPRRPLRPGAPPAAAHAPARYVFCARAPARCVCCARASALRAGGSACRQAVCVLRVHGGSAVEPIWGRFEANCDIQGHAIHTARGLLVQGLYPCSPTPPTYPPTMRVPCRSPSPPSFSTPAPPTTKICGTSWCAHFQIKACVISSLL